jgi:hypothetical protein
MYNKHKHIYNAFIHSLVLSHSYRSYHHHETNIVIEVFTHTLS